MMDPGGTLIEIFAIVGEVAGGGAAIGSLAGGALGLLSRKARASTLELAGVGASFVGAFAVAALVVDRIGGLP